MMQTSARPVKQIEIENENETLKLDPARIYSVERPRTASHQFWEMKHC